MISHFVPKQDKPIQIISLIESPLAIQNLPSILAASAHVTGTIFASYDFSLSLSLLHNPPLSTFSLARQQILYSSRAAGVNNIIDAVCTSYAGQDNEQPQVLKNECEDGALLGYTGKQCIHPSQIETIQSTFAPKQVDIDWAVRVIAGDQIARESGKGAWKLDGKMIDRPVVGIANVIVEKAKLMGFDVSRMIGDAGHNLQI
jgi:citrate lyase subunit beta-like protein